MNIRGKTTVSLANRLNEIDKEMANLCIEYNLIIRELWYRYPDLINDKNLKPRAKSKILKQARKEI